MPFRQAGAIRYFSFDAFDERILHAVFTRHGGVSRAPWASLNMGATVGDEPANVAENRRRAFGSVGREPESSFDAWLVHGADVICAEEPRSPHSVPAKADAVLTDNPKVTLFLRFADCVPILLHDVRRNVVGIVHAGWLGTVRGAARAAIARMVERYRSDPADIIAAIGPSIGPDHYQIGADVVSQVRDAFGSVAETLLTTRAGYTHFDLWAGNRYQLESMGVRQIENAGLCTVCSMDDWYSHRGEHGKTGRFGALIAPAG